MTTMSAQQAGAVRIVARSFAAPHGELPVLTSQRRAAWERDGFFIVPGFGGAAGCRAMHAGAVGLARKAGGAGMAGSAIVQPETKATPDLREPEDGVSKIFKLHRDQPAFRSFIQDERVLDLAAGLIGPSLDCFLSQFIFKNPGALGQPWHQDAFYFRFDRAPQLGLWLAVTEATPENGCLRVLPGSHREPVHVHETDRRPGANLGYLEIVDHDMSASIPVEMQTGDLLVFHSHLMHCSTDNESSRLRAAMVYHFADAGTVDLDEKPVAINDWMPVRRRVDTRIEIAAPRERVLEALVDGVRYPDWNPYLVKIEGAIEPGGQILARSRNADGRELEVPVEVLTIDADGMRWQGGLPDRAQFKGDHFFALEVLAPARTRLHHYEIFTGTLVGDIIVPREAEIRENFERMNAGLRAFCEDR